MKKKNAADLTERNLKALKKRELKAKEDLINRAGSLDRRVTNLSDLLDDVIRRLTALELEVSRKGTLL
jgi:hypothetical protein